MSKTTVQVFDRLTPCTLVLIVAPAFVLFLPDNLPFVYAGCASGSVRQKPIDIEPGNEVEGTCKVGSDVKVAVVSSEEVDNTSQCLYKARVQVSIAYGYSICWHAVVQQGNECGHCADCEATVSGPKNLHWTDYFSVEASESYDEMDLLVSVKDNPGPCTGEENIEYTDEGVARDCDEGTGFTVENVVYFDFAICEP